MVTRYFLTVAALLAATTIRPSDNQNLRTDNQNLRTLEDWIFEDGELVEEEFVESSFSDSETDIIGLKPARRSSRTRQTRELSLPPIAVPYAYTIPYNCIATTSNRALRPGKRKTGGAYNISSETTALEITTDDTSTSPLSSSLPTLPTVISTQADEIGAIPAENQLSQSEPTLPIAGKPIAGKKRKRGEYPQLRESPELRQRGNKRIKRANGMTEELYREISQFNATAKTKQQHGKKLNPIEQMFFDLTQGRDNKLPREVLDAIEQRKSILKKEIERNNRV